MRSELFSKESLDSLNYSHLPKKQFPTDLFTIPLLIKNRVSIFAPLKVDFGEYCLI